LIDPPRDHFTVTYTVIHHRHAIQSKNIYGPRRRSSSDCSAFLPPLLSPLTTGGINQSSIPTAQPQPALSKQGTEAGGGRRPGGGSSSSLLIELSGTGRGKEKARLCFALLPFRGAQLRGPAGGDGQRGPGADAPEAGGLGADARRRQRPPAPQGALRHPARRHRSGTSSLSLTLHNTFY